MDEGDRILVVDDDPEIRRLLRDYLEANGGELPPFPQSPELPKDKILVHRDYLCTWIGEPT